MSMRTTFAALQTSLGGSREENIRAVIDLIREAHSKKAQVILPSELFEGPYFPREEKDEFFSWARSASNNETIIRFQELAKNLGVVIPVSFFEVDGPHFYNSVAVIDADGKNLGIYRKSHIPDGPGYEEKFYFKPGNTGFKVWNTRFGNLGIGICWDQWFPECARAMVLQGADILMYPTAIGSEPEAPELNTKDLWQRSMIGHAVSNVIPVVAANRIGKEGPQSFYGHSFICDHRGNILHELKESTSGIITSTFDFEEIKKNRASFGFFRDRRPELYEILSR